MTRRICTMFMMGFFAASLSVWAQTPSKSDAAKPGQALRSLQPGRMLPRTSAAAVALLKKRVEDVDWVETPLEEVVSWLRDESEDRVNIVARWSALGVESVDADSLVTLKLSRVTVAEVLNEMLDELSEDGALTYHAIGNTLKISTRADFDRKLYVRVYDVTDLLMRVEDFGQSAPQIDLQNQQRSGGGSGGGGGGGQSVFQGGSSQEQKLGGEQAEQELLERLTDLSIMITSTIAPQSWQTTGNAGAPGQITPYNRSLIVLNTIEVHENITGLFSFEN